MSQYDLPYPLPGKYDPSGNTRNPTGSIPRPSPTDMPVGGWIGAATLVSNWTANPDPATLWRTFWSSPLFDLRPDLGALSDNRANARVSALPIWRAAGQNIASQLFVQISTLPVITGWKITSVEDAHICDATQAVSITAPEDVTSQFSSMGVAALLTYHPHGDGYPVRYWRLRLQFDVLANMGSLSIPPIAPVNFVVQAAVY